MHAGKAHRAFALDRLAGGLHRYGDVG